MSSLPGHSGQVLFTINPKMPTARDRSDGTLRWAQHIEHLAETESVLLAITQPDNRRYPARAAVLNVASPTPVNPLATERWVLVIDSLSGFTVIEYPTIELACEAFAEHVGQRTDTSDAYTYVYEPRQPRTAYPAGWLGSFLSGQTSSAARTARPRGTADDADAGALEVVVSYTADTPTHYGVTKVRRFFGNLIRIEILRDRHKERSYAVAAAGLTPSTLFTILTPDPHKWYDQTPPVWFDTSVKFDALAALDERLFTRTVRLLNR